jgi:hypothetical protein
MNNIKDDESWETDEEDYFRLKVDNVQKIKYALKRTKRMNVRKVSKFSKKEEMAIVKENRKFLESEIFPSISLNKYETKFLENDLKNENFQKENYLKKLKFRDEDYNITIKPEIGSSLIFEINKNSLSFVKVAKEYLEATTKIFYKSTNSNNNIKIDNTGNSQIKLDENNIEGSNNIKKIKKKYKKKKKRAKDERIIIEETPEIKIKKELKRIAYLKKKKRKKTREMLRKKTKKNKYSTIVEVKKLEKDD